MELAKRPSFAWMWMIPCACSWTVGRFTSPLGPSRSDGWKEASFHACQFFLVLRAVGTRRFKSWMIRPISIWKNRMDSEGFRDPCLIEAYVSALMWYASSWRRLKSSDTRRRKDDLAMETHHLLAMALLATSWMANQMEAGAAVMMVHDLADPFLHAAKLLRHAGWKKAADAAFVAFAAAFVAGRVLWLPWMVSCARYVAQNLVEASLVAMLIALVPLHLFWTGLIARAASRRWRGRDLQDDRSDDEEDIQDDGKGNGWHKSGSTRKNALIHTHTHENINRRRNGKHMDGGD